MSTNRDNNITRPLGQLLLRQLLLAYILIALVITGIQMFFEYRDTQKIIVLNLQSLAKTFSPGAESALWELQETLLNSMVNGISANSAVVSVDIIDSDGKIITSWRDSSGRSASPELTVQQALYHNEGDGVKFLGTLRIASSNSVLISRIQDTLQSVVVSDTALFACLGLLLWLLARSLIVRPLVQFSNQVGALSISGQGNTIDLGLVEVTEIETLKQGFNHLMQLLATSYTRISEQNILLQHEKAQMRCIIDSIPDMIFIKDKKGFYLGCNKAFEAYTGRAESAITSKSDFDLFDAETAGIFRQKDQEMMESGSALVNEESVVYPDGGKVTLETLKTIFYGPDGEMLGLIGISRDITEKKKADSLIWTQAYFDHLTGLPNRRLFHDRLNQEIKKAHRTQSKTALLFIDLDHFKEINDSLGHEVGDLLLAEAAVRIKDCMRDYDTLARFGGDEFTVIMAELRDASDVGQISTNIIDRLSEPYVLNNQESFVSASIGIALYPDDATSVTDLIKQADQAMYAAKKAGRGCFNFFTRSLQEASEFRTHLASDLRHAIKDAQFEVYYQPIVDLFSGHIRKAEALLRWKHPQRGFISPGTFIPIAEEIGTIQEIGDWVFSQAVRQARHWQSERDSDFQISVNMSPVQFIRNINSHSHWIEQLRDIGLPGSSIVIEITEGLLMSTEAAIPDTLLKFRDAGIQVAIDDFGTGYSSLSYLKKFHIDYLKIDQSFINNLALDSADFALCEAIVVMAHKLGLKVIAEGVETGQQRDLLRQIMCDYAQGYLFSRPVPVDEFDKFPVNVSL